MHRARMILARMGRHQQTVLAGHSAGEKLMARSVQQTQTRGMARKKGAVARPTSQLQVVERDGAPPPAAWPEFGPWTPVVEKESGRVYYWNKDTNETTALGEYPPGVALANQSNQVGYAQPQQPGLGRVMAEGAAFGVGAGIGRSIIGSFFGGSDDIVGTGGTGGNGGDGGDGGWI